MTRVRIDLFSSIDGYTSAGGGQDDPMGKDWGPLTAAYVATRTMKQRVFGDTSGAGTGGVDDIHAAAFFERIGAEIMGAAMFGLHAFPDDPDWTGWWGEEPPFGFPVYVLTSTAPRPEIEMRGGTTFHFRDSSIEDVLAEATEAAGGLDVRVGAASHPLEPSCEPGSSMTCTSRSPRSCSIGVTACGRTCAGSRTPTV